MTRALHWVGTLPDITVEGYGSRGTPDENRMRWFLDRSQGHEMTALPCDQDPDWIVKYLRYLEDVDDVFEVARPGEYTSYADVRRYRVKRGVTLLPEHVDDMRAPHLRYLVDLARRVRADYPDRQGLRFQVSLPHPFDLAYAVFGTTLRADAHWRVFRDVAVAEVRELCTSDAVDLVFQIETPIVLSALNRVPRMLRRRAAKMLAWRMLTFVNELPRTANLILHLCYGDLRHKAAVEPTSLEPAVLYLNALAPMLRSIGRDLPPVHIPAAYGDRPPPADVMFYEPLRHLAPAWNLIAGVIDENSTRASAKGLIMFEGCAQRPSLAVATACGLGRRIPGADLAAAALMARLAPLSGGTTTTLETT